MLVLKIQFLHFKEEEEEKKASLPHLMLFKISNKLSKLKAN